MSRYLADRVSRTPRVQIWRSCEVRELVGSATLAAVVVRDLRNGEERPLEATALFVLIGSMPHITWLQGQIPLDDEGFVRMARRGRPLRDVRDGESTASSRLVTRAAAR